MNKFNRMDFIIVLLIIAVALGGFWYLNRKGDASEQNANIEFTVEIARVPIEVANAYTIGDETTFGTKNVDRGVIKNVEIFPFTQDFPNPITGEMNKVALEGFYNAYVTIQTKGMAFEDRIQSPQEVLNVGVEMIFHGKGFAGKGYIVGLNAIKEGE